MSSRWLTFLLLIFISRHDARAVVPAIQESDASPHSAGPAEPRSGSARQAALEAQSKAEADPSEPNLFFYASSLMKLSHTAAETIYRFAVNKYPDSVRLHAGLASALWALGKPDEGAAELWKAAQLAPDDPHPLEFLASSEHIPDALYPEVVTGLRRLHLRYPKDGLILFDYEMVVSNRYKDRSKVPEDFLPTVREAIRLTPQLPQAYFEIGLVYEQRKDYREEVQALQKAVELSPQDQHYRYNLAMAYKHLGDKEAFLRELAIFKKMHQQSSEAAP